MSRTTTLSATSSGALRGSLGTFFNAYMAARRVAADLESRRSPKASDLRILGMRADALSHRGAF